MNRTWIKCSDRLPPDDITVWTKIDDHNGERNVQTLKRMKGNALWWYPDERMYVYYTPTHWAP
jgi:hypothetical protein